MYVSMTSLLVLQKPVHPKKLHVDIWLLSQVMGVESEQEEKEEYTIHLCMYDGENLGHPYNRKHCCVL